MPKSRVEYWGSKIEANRQRDAKKRKLLRALGWHVLTVWECELKDPSKLSDKLVRVIDSLHC